MLSLLLPLLLLGFSCRPEEFGLGESVKIRADEISIRKNEGLMVFTGNIQIEKGGLEILVRKDLTIHYRDMDGKIRPSIMYMQDVEASSARGVRISGDRGDYDFVNSILTIRDNVVVNEKNSVIFVDRAVYDTLSEEINMFGNRSGEDGSKKKVIIIMDNLEELGRRKDDKKPSGN